MDIKPENRIFNRTLQLITLKGLFVRLVKFFHKQPNAGNINDDFPEKFNAKLTNKNFYPLDHFKQRLILEKRRAERLQTQSSILIVSQNKSDSIESQITFQDKYFETSLKTICENLRETDAVSLLSKDKLLILLPDTEVDGAKLVCNILYKQLLTNNHSSKYKKSITNIEFEIIPFPQNPANENISTAFSNENSLTTSPHSSDVMKNFGNPHNFLEQYNDEYDSKFCVMCSNGQSLIMKMVNNTFIDQQQLAKFQYLAARLIKKTIDVTLASILLLLLSPLLLIIALLIKLTSEGPVLFIQKRMGHEGKQFNFLKFRSMYTSSDTKSHQEYVKKLINGKNNEINNGSKDNPMFKIADDPRITPIGKFIRKTSLDELPQLWNVITGDMSLIGPRPPIPYEVEDYKTWHLRRIIEVKPGMTGLWQISGRNKTTFDEMVRLDIQYLRNWSIALDFKILFKTFFVFFNSTGT